MIIASFLFFQNQAEGAMMLSWNHNHIHKYSLCSKAQNLFQGHAYQTINQSNSYSSLLLQTQCGSDCFCRRTLVVCFFFRVKRPFETVFQSISGRLPKRGRKRRERIEESKNVQTTTTRTYCKSSRPLPYSHPNK